MAEKKPKIKTSDTIIIKRSKIQFAPYNPRKKDPKVVEALKRNLKKVGYLGGIVWNEETGNLVGGHKRVEAMDLIYNYDGTTDKDYEIKVEKVIMDPKTEKEQNIFLNNKRVQGEMDYEMLAEILPEIDIDATGLDDYDLQIIESIVPSFDMGHNEVIKNDSKELAKDYEAHKAATKQLKQEIKNGISEKQTPSYFTVTFANYDDKAGFLERFGIDGDTVFIKGEDLQKAINE